MKIKGILSRKFDKSSPFDWFIRLLFLFLALILIIGSAIWIIVVIFSVFVSFCKDLPTGTIETVRSQLFLDGVKKSLSLIPPIFFISYILSRAIFILRTPSILKPILISSVLTISTVILFFLMTIPSSVSSAMRPWNILNDQVLYPNIESKILKGSYGCIDTGSFWGMEMVTKDSIDKVIDYYVSNPPKNYIKKLEDRAGFYGENRRNIYYEAQDKSKINISVTPLEGNKTRILASWSK